MINHIANPKEKYIILKPTTKMATKQPRPKTMKVGKNLGHQRRRKPGESKTKEPESEKKRVEDDKGDEDHFDDKICMLCCEEIDIVAKGQCNHVICYKCSSRMRAICGESYCVVCRHELKKVQFYSNINVHEVFFVNLCTHSCRALSTKLGYWTKVI